MTNEKKPTNWRLPENIAMLESDMKAQDIADKLGIDVNVVYPARSARLRKIGKRAPGPGKGNRKTFAKNGGRNKKGRPSFKELLEGQNAVADAALPPGTLLKGQKPRTLGAVDTFSSNGTSGSIKVPVANGVKEIEINFEKRSVTHFF